MKQVLIRRTGGPEVLEFVEQETPAPGPGEILIRTRAMAVSRPDILIRKGLYTWSPPLPANPGNELTGVVEAVGPGVAEFAPGQGVLLSSRELPYRGGCYTEYLAAPAAAAHALPDGVDLEAAAVLPTYLVAHAMLKGLGRPASGEGGLKTIFVNGVAGGIGIGLTQLAKAQGATVIGSVGSEAKAAFARSVGVDHIVYHRTESLLDRVMEITGGRGVDASFDHIIGPRFIDCVRMLGDFGVVVAFNRYSPMPDQDVFETMRGMSIRSPALRVFNMHTYDADLPALRVLTRELIALQVSGAVKPVIGARLPFAEAARAHELLEAGEVLGKILLIP